MWILALLLMGFVLVFVWRTKCLVPMMRVSGCTFSIVSHGLIVLLTVVVALIRATLWLIENIADGLSGCWNTEEEEN